MKTLRPFLLVLPIMGLLAAASPARAERTQDVIPVETGFLEVRGGVRLTPQGAFEQGLAKNGFKLTSPALATPAVIVPLGYRVDRSWAALVEFGYSFANYGLANTETGAASTLRASTFSIQIAGQWVPPLEWGRLEPVLGFGVGYYLTTVKSSDGSLTGANAEANATGVFVSAGLRYQLAKNIGLSFEDRYALAAAGVASHGTLNVGGNTTSLGLYYLWR